MVIKDLVNVLVFSKSIITIAQKYQTDGWLPIFNFLSTSVDLIKI